jgi:hypothetical protein
VVWVLEVLLVVLLDLVVGPILGVQPKELLVKEVNLMVREVGMFDSALLKLFQPEVDSMVLVEVL